MQTEVTKVKGKIGRPRVKFTKPVNYKKIERNNSFVWVRAGRGKPKAGVTMEKKMVPYNNIPDEIPFEDNSVSNN